MKYLIYIILSTFFLVNCSTDNNIDDVHDTKKIRKIEKIKRVPEVQKNYITPKDFLNKVASTPNGGILELGNEHVLINGSRLEISKDITIKGGGFKRADTPHTTLSKEYIVGNKYIECNDTSGFKVGDWIGVSWGTAMNLNTGANEVKITKIDSNRITFSGSFTRNGIIGSNVHHRYTLIKLNQNNTITMDGCLFDGNKANNSYCYDWKANKVCHLYGSHHVIQNSIIIDSPNESFTLYHGARLLYNRFFNLNGSVAHFSNPINHTTEERTLIIGNYGDGICLTPLSINGHNEGLWTNSMNSQYIYIHDNTFFNGGESCYGSFGTDDFDFDIGNNYYENFKKKVHSDPMEEINLSLDTYINVADRLLGR